MVRFILEAYHLNIFKICNDWIIGYTNTIYKIYYHCHTCGHNFSLVVKRELYSGEECPNCFSRNTELVDWEKR